MADVSYSPSVMTNFKILSLFVNNLDCKNEQIISDDISWYCFRIMVL